MAASPVSTTTEGMKQAGSHFEHAITSANNHLQQINSEMATLQASWKGDASVKFGQAMNDWEEQFDIIIKKLAQMLQVMGTNAGVYTNTEETALSTAGAWTGGLSGI